MNSKAFGASKSRLPIRGRILVLFLLLTQLTGNAPGDLATLGQFVIAGLLYAISVVLEQKYKW